MHSTVCPSKRLCLIVCMYVCMCARNIGMSTYLFALVVEASSQTKVTQSQVAVGVNKNIGRLQIPVHIYMYCVYVCIYVCMYACMHVRIVWNNKQTFHLVSFFLNIHVSSYVCMYACIYKCIYENCECVHVWMYLCRTLAE